MTTDVKKPKGVIGLKVERVFANSRLAGELMAGAYENLVPISRKSLNPTPPWRASSVLYGPIRKESRSCLTGT